MRKNIKGLLIVAAFTLILTLCIILVGVLLVKKDPAPQDSDLPEPPAQSSGDTIQFGSSEIPVDAEAPATTHDPALFELVNGRMVYNDPAVKTYTGVDVSAHREDIDWNAVKRDGVDFAMLRVGWRGNTEGKLYLDEYFVSNIAGASAAGLDIGVYFYSQAITVQEAVEEANAVLGWIKDYDITYPVVYDWEYVSSDARTGSLDDETLNACALAFCETIEQAGYIPMIYFNLDLGYRRFDLGRLSKYDFWLAEYDGPPTFYYDYAMLQYTSNGKVAGSEDKVDLNISFVDYAAITRQKRSA